MSVNVVLKSVFDDKGIRNAEKAFSGLGSTIGKFGGIVGGALAIGAVTNYAKDAITAASNLSAEIEGVNQIFGDAATSVQEFAKTASTNFGIARADALQAAKNFGGFATSAGLSGQAAANFSTSLVGAAGDLASFADVPVEEALAAIQSGLAGQSEPLRKFQIFLDDTTLKAYALDKGLGDSYATMTQGDKALLRQSAIMDQLGVKQGDFINYQDTFGNALKTVQTQFQDLQAEIGLAMLPAMEDLLAAVKEIIPEIGEKLLTAVNAVDWAKLATDVGNFLGWFIDNIAEIAEFAKAITITTIAFGALTTALEVAKTAQILLNIAALQNPYIIGAIAIAAGIGLVISAFNKLTGATDDTTTATNNSTWAVNNLNNADVSRLDGRLYQLQIQAQNTATALAGASNALIPASPTGAPGQDLKPLNPKPGQVYTGYYVDSNNQAVWFTQTWTGSEWTKRKVMTYTPPSAKKTSVKETTADRFKAVQDVIKSAQKAILGAEENYARNLYTINRNSAERITELQKNAEAERANIIAQSMARLTEAFKSASAISLGELFDKKTTTKLITDVKQLSSTLSVSVTKEVETVAYTSVEKVLEGLRKKLSDSKLLLANASELASKGFSQTFIEQVIETGSETGNALAGAILDASPETQAEMRQLFTELETVSNTGMDALAQDIYDKQGLATQALKKLYSDVQFELNESLKLEQKALATALADAGYAFGLAIKDIKDTFLTDLEGFDGWFAGLNSTIEQLLAKMEMLSGKGLTDTQKALTAANSGTDLAKAVITKDVSVKNLGNASGLVIDSVEDVAGSLAYLEARIAAANKYISSSASNAIQDASAAAKVSEWTKAVANLSGAAASGSAAGTVININVKTDTTQSQAMVGKTIGNIVTKYVTTGGSVLVSGNA